MRISGRILYLRYPNSADQLSLILWNVDGDSEASLFALESQGDDDVS